MKFETNWSFEELKSYLFIFCANADYKESSKEIEYVKSIVSEKGYKKIHDEFDKDNDFQSLQKIQSSLERLGIKDKELDQLCFEVKDMFKIDGKFDILERNLFFGLKRIIESSKNASKDN